MKKATVVITTYNGEKFLLEQLESIKSQSYMNTEVVISDDGSTDSSVEIARKYINDNGLEEKWILSINEKNKGYARNFLEAALLASGDVVFFCDQDDVWESTKIEEMMNVLEINPDINMLASNLIPFYSESGGRRLDSKQLKQMRNDGQVDRIVFAPSNFHLKRSGCTMCVRKKYLESILEYWIPNWEHDDFLWKISAVDGSCAIYQKFLTNRRMHSNNTTNIKNRSREWRIEQLQKRLEYNKALERYAESCKISAENNMFIRKYSDALALRSELLRKRSLGIWFILALKYRECYPRIKGLILDLYLVFFSNCRIK